MAKARSPYRKRAFEIWRESGGKTPLKDIAKQLSVSDSQIRKWKNQDQWAGRLNGNVTDEDTPANSDVTVQSSAKRKRGGQPGNANAAKPHGFGNQNAVGNKGGPPRGSKNALISGKYEHIWHDCLDEEELEVCENLNMDELALIDQEIELLTIRERRMMKRVQEWAKKREDIEERITQSLQESQLKYAVYDERAAGMKDSVVMALAPTEIVQNKKSILDRLLRIENHLTDIQAKKTRAIELKHKIMIARGLADGNDDTGDVQSFFNALGGQVKRAWVDDH